jgi:hypothetical protein
MGAPGTIPISINRRAIALDPCTLITRAATPEGSVSSDPDSWVVSADSIGAGLDFFLFFLNVLLPRQAKLKIAFNFILS